jgi:hypothetical protein
MTDDKRNDGRVRAGRVAGRGAAVGVDGDKDIVLIDRVRRLEWRLVEKGAQLAQVKRHVLALVGNFAHNLALEECRARAIDCLDARARLLGLPRRRTAALDVPHVEHAPALVVAHLGQLRVEIERAERRRDADRGRPLHLHQRHNDLVEHAQVHVRRLLAVDDVGADALQRVRSPTDSWPRSEYAERERERV